MNRLRNFIQLPVIVGTFPTQILNGQPEDAVPVMTLFNFIASQVNSNVPPLINTLQSGFIFVLAGSVGGTANAITLTPTPANAGYTAGQSYRFPAASTNTGAVTINTSGLGTRAVTTSAGAALTGGEFIAGGIYDISDNGTNYELVNSAQGTALGSFTPALAFGGASVGITYSSQLGRYVKISNLVFWTIYIALSNKGSSTGAVTITGFPFVANASVGANSGGASGFIENITFTGTYSVGMNTGSATAGMLHVTSGSSVTNFTNSDFANNSDFAFSGWYTV
jgi:hypothetical protein